MSSQPITKMTCDQSGIEYLRELGVDAGEVLSGTDQSSESESSEGTEDSVLVGAEEGGVFKSSPAKRERRKETGTSRGKARKPFSSPTKSSRSPKKESPKKQLEKTEFLAKDGTIWTTEETPKGRTKSYNIVREGGGVIGAAANPNLAPVEIFKLMITREIVDLAVKYTNEFAGAYLEQERKKGKRENQWTPVTEEDIYAYIGIILSLGVEKARLLPVSEIWTSNPKYINNRVVATMPLHRFQQITHFLRFDDRMARHKAEAEGMIQEKLAYISQVFDPFVENIQSHFRPYESLVVDEMLIRFKGKSKFRVYMKSKPGKYGMKVWVVCDAETGYMLRLIIYEGKKGDKVETQVGMKVVLALVEKYFKTGRSITMDNFFTSKALAYQLMARDMSLLGTLNRGKLDVIPEFVEGRGREVESSIFAFQKDLTMVSYMQRKNKPVLLLSTRHHNADVSDYKKKPQIILDYNRTKGGVDTASQMIVNFTCQRATRRWPMKIFQAMCDIAALNSYIIWTCVHGKPGKGKYNRRLFLRQLSESLMAPCVRTRSQQSHSCSFSPHIRTAMYIMGHPPISIQQRKGPILGTRGPCEMIATTETGLKKRCNTCTRTRCDGCQYRICKSHGHRVTFCHNCEFVQVVREKTVPPELNSSI